MNNAAMQACPRLQKKPEFPERMYVYNYRIYDRYRRKVASLAVLADEIEHWRPSEYSYELWGSRAGLWFPLVKLLDYRERWSELESSRNPFAVVVMAHLKASETAHRTGRAAFNGSSSWQTLI